MSLLTKVLGGETETPAPVVGSDGHATESAVDLAALKKQARKSGRNLSRAQVTADEIARAAELEELFANENWEEIAALYFNARYAITGWDGFLLSDKQQRVLGSTMGTCMKLLLAIDPRWVALTVFTVNMSAFITDKELRYQRIVAEQRQKKG